MVQLYLNCQKDHICHKQCLYRTSLEDKLKYVILAESEESTVNQCKIMSIQYLKAFQTPKIGYTEIVTWMTQ
jgi:hypothetical protein